MRLTSLCSVLMIVALGCGEGPATRVEAPPLDVKAIVVKAMAQYDKDGDGLIAGEELTAASALAASMVSLDEDGDGKLADVELRTFVDLIVESKVGIIGVSCEVSTNGKPLANAHVRLIPEAFFGDTIKPAEGTSDREGFVILQAADTDRAGVYPGIYRVEVSVKDEAGKELLPAKYNTESELGQAIALGIQGFRGQMLIDLKP